MKSNFQKTPESFYSSSRSKSVNVLSVIRLLLSKKNDLSSNAQVPNDYFSSVAIQLQVQMPNLNLDANSSQYFNPNLSSMQNSKIYSITPVTLGDLEKLILSMKYRKCYKIAYPSIVKKPI